MLRGVLLTSQRKPMAEANQVSRSHLAYLLNTRLYRRLNPQGYVNRRVQKIQIIDGMKHAFPRTCTAALKLSTNRAMFSITTRFDFSTHLEILNNIIV